MGRRNLCLRTCPLTGPPMLVVAPGAKVRLARSARKLAVPLDTTGWEIAGHLLNR